MQLFKKAHQFEKHLESEMLLPFDWKERRHVAAATIVI